MSYGADFINALPLPRLADELVGAMPENVREPIAGTGGYYVDADHVDLLAEAALTFVAEVVATVIDAGSEREAVMENAALYDELVKEFKSWTAAG